jgi:RNA polymerase sigma factor (sigma-70 family)
MEQTQRHTSPTLIPYGNEAGQDSTLVHEAREGNPSAWRELVTRHRPALVRVAGHLPRPRWAEPEDLVQEALGRAWRYRLSLRGDQAGFLPWVRTISRRAGLTQVKADARLDAARQRSGLPARATAGVSVSAASRPDRELAELKLAGRKRRVVQAALQALTPLERAVVLHWAAGLSTREFRQPDGRPYASNSFRQTLHRARGKLAAWGWRRRRTRAVA